MADLLVDGLEDGVLAALAARAANLGISQEDLARQILAEAASEGDTVPLIDRRRSLRTEDPLGTPLDSTGVIRAEREARTARILGEDEAEAWARGYREALGLDMPREGEAA